MLDHAPFNKQNVHSRNKLKIIVQIIDDSIHTTIFFDSSCIKL